MIRTPFFTLFRQPERPRGTNAAIRQESLAWLETPIDEKDGDPHLYRHADATPIELFFDLFFVANLSTFTATHEINNMSVLGAYIAFLGVIWFTWLQVTLFDIRFARDSIFERICKAVQLGVMVGIASATTRLTTQIRDENSWAFENLCFLLASSRGLLAIQYTVIIYFLYRDMRPSVTAVAITAASLFASSLVYIGLFFGFREHHDSHPHLWVVWFVLFGLELWAVMGVSWATPTIGFEYTHLNVRMGLLTLIIIGEGVIAVTRITSKIIRPGGWNHWSFVHILGITTNVYLIWQAYFDLSPRGPLGRLSQQLWAQLHFPFHVVLILLLEGSQILTLTLDITLKIRWLQETMLFACEEPRPNDLYAIQLLRTTIADMGIEYNRGAMKEQAVIFDILGELQKPLCPSEGLTHSLTIDRKEDLLGNVTAALFHSMGNTPAEGIDIIQMSSDQLLSMYIHTFDFVYSYFFTVGALAMALFAAFVPLARRHNRRLYIYVGVVVRLGLAVCLSILVTYRHPGLGHAFMKSPVILYAFSFVLLTVLLVDRLLDYLERRETRELRTQGSERQPLADELPVPLRQTGSAGAGML